MYAWQSWELPYLCKDLASPLPLAFLHGRAEIWNFFGMACSDRRFVFLGKQDVELKYLHVDGPRLCSWPLCLAGLGLGALVFTLCY